jgi:hypothetical protein
MRTRLGRLGFISQGAEQERPEPQLSGLLGKRSRKTIRAGQLSPQHSATFEILVLKASRVCFPFSASMAFWIITTGLLGKSSWSMEAGSSSSQPTSQTASEAPSTTELGATS